MGLHSLFKPLFNRVPKNPDLLFIPDVRMNMVCHKDCIMSDLAIYFNYCSFQRLLIPGIIRNGDDDKKFYLNMGKSSIFKKPGNLLNLTLSGWYGVSRHKNSFQGTEMRVHPQQ